MRHDDCLKFILFLGLLLHTGRTSAGIFEPSTQSGKVWWNKPSNFCLGNEWNEEPTQVIQWNVLSCRPVGIRADGVVVYPILSSPLNNTNWLYAIERHRGSIRGMISSEFTELILLCDGTLVDAAKTPMKLPRALHRAPATQLVGRGQTAAVLYEDGAVLAWGTASDSLPTTLLSNGVSQVTASARHFHVLNTNGTVESYEPGYSQKLNSPPGMKPSTSLVAVDDGVCALHTDQTVTAWASGQSFLWQGANLLPPIQKIQAGVRSFFLTTTEGNVWQWDPGAKPFLLTPSLPAGILPNLITDNGAGSLIIANGPAPKWQPARAEAVVTPFQYRVYVGETATFVAGLRCGNPVRFQWYFKGTPVVNQTNATLIITPSGVEQEGPYSVTMTDAENRTAQANCYLRVDPRFEPGTAYQWISGKEGVRSRSLTNRIQGVSLDSNGEYFAIDQSGAGPVSELTIASPRQYPRPVASLRQIWAGRTSSLEYFMLTDSGAAYKTASNALVFTTPLRVIDLALSARVLGVMEDGTLRSNLRLVSGERMVPPPLEQVIQISATEDYVLALLWDGSVRGWGNNVDGVLNLPANLRGIVRVAAGANHAVALREDGSVVCWGGNEGAWVQPPTSLPPLRQITAGSSNTLAITRTGELVLWGTDSATGMVGNHSALRGGGFRQVLAVNQNFIALREGIPFFSQHPQSQQIEVGKAAILSVELSSRSPFNLQWYHDGNKLLGETNSTLNIPSVQLNDVGRYEVVVECAAGDRASQPAYLNLAGPPSWVTQPEGFTTETWSSVVLEARATGSQPLFYQWMKDGIELVAETNAFLEFAPIRSSETGVYTLIVSNSLGRLTSQSAPIQVHVPEIIQGRKTLLRIGSKWQQHADAISGSYIAPFNSTRVGTTRAPLGMGYKGVQPPPLLPSLGNFWDTRSALVRQLKLPDIFAGQVWSNLTVKMYTTSGIHAWSSLWQSLGPQNEFLTHNISKFPGGFFIAAEHADFHIPFQTVINPGEPQNFLYSRSIYLVSFPVPFDYLDPQFYFDCEVEADVYIIPPRITRQPRDQFATLGAEVTLDLEVEAKMRQLPSNMSYLWFKNGEYLTTTYQPKLVLSPFDSSMVGSYRVEVDDQAEIARSISVNVSLAQKLEWTQLAADKISLSWSAPNSVLESAPTLMGPWITVPGATSPWVVSIQPEVPQRYFRFTGTSEGRKTP